MFFRTDLVDKGRWLSVGILLLILAIGIFLRTYRFHDFLLFEKDQVRDAALVEAVLHGLEPWPLLGPSMRGSGETKDELFRVGPVFVYFQILSAKLFGMRPTVLAYPDWLFSVLTLPLFFVVMHRLFSVPISILITALFSVAFFPLQYGRFAWNPNALPFFTLLFLLSLAAVLEKRDRTPWPAVVALGVAMGIGIQLHALALLSFSITLVLACGASFFLCVKKKEMNRSFSRKGFAIRFCVFLAVVGGLNAPQIESEVSSGFSNTRTLFSSPVREGKGSAFSVKGVAEALLCQAQANFHSISSLSGEECILPSKKLFASGTAGKKAREKTPFFFLAASLVFSLVGFFLCGRRFWRETDQAKKTLLGTFLLFSLVFFLLMIPILASGFLEYRYFLPVFFLPFLFLGFLFGSDHSRKSAARNIAALVLLGGFFYSNMSTIFTTYRTLSSGFGNDGHSVYLGEIEAMVSFLHRESSGAASISGKDDILKNLFPPLFFVAKQEGLSLSRGEEGEGTGVHLRISKRSGHNSKDADKKSCGSFGNFLVCRDEPPN